MERKKKCKMVFKEKGAKYLNNHIYFPWGKTLIYIKTRCNNPKASNYNQYGGRGIKYLITKEELKFLWFRDKAYLMKRTSIDRIDSYGNYTLSNCRYREWLENSKDVDRTKFLGEKNPNWKGGFPHCPICNKQLADYNAKSCREHIKAVK